ncbi:hypothetical protein [Rhodococcus sp. (in: high G+C Gram-positive bacteria)]|uniref:hypothetical protein n=1 Tax=Rhodococcus sp. TaxID=1831 RepID=UPI001A21A9C0|nr:hypothetical protein [Rhodococcus sp. (in: high G+C Gram-positive bacteria)]MBJ7479265.1 hypothetical protein [Rhodococcus sp. (in: high G+C Gram-positive bacteria)]
MSVITEDFRRLDGVAPFPADLAFVYFTVPRRRENAAGTWVVVPVEVKCRLVAGKLTSPNLDPGEATVQIGPHGPTYKIIIPATDARLWDLIEMYETPDPPLVSLVKQYLEDTKEARDIAVAAAEGVAGVGEDLEQIAQDRAAAVTARNQAQGFAGDASESRGLAATAAVSAGDSASLAGQRAGDAADHASAASASATAAGQSEAAAAQHKEDAEAAADLAVSTAAGIQDVAADAARVAADRVAVADDRTAVSADRQATVDARSGAIAAQGLAEGARDDAAETKTAVDNTKAAIDATLDAYGTQFTADKNASHQAVVDATAQANRAESEANRAEQAADDIAAGAVADGAVSTVKIQDGAVTKAKTSTAVQASLDKADTSVQEGDSRLTNARPPTAHSHAVADVTGLQGALDGKAPTSHTHAEGDVTGLTAKLATKADLDGAGKVLAAQLPAVALTDFLGAVGSQAAMLALSGQRGDWCTRTDRGTDWQLIAEPSSTLANWREKTYPASPVSSVNGRTGAVDTSSADITDATTVGRNVIKATDAAAARAAIGAGTGNGTSNLALGTTSSTAMRGDGVQAVASLPGSPVSGILYCIPE